MVPGLMHVRFGPYHMSDVEVVAAFDVDARKVGCDLAEAINASENNTIRFAEVPPAGVTVQRGPTLDGLGEYYREIITESEGPAADVARVLRETGADVLVSYLPVGSEQADRYYAQCAIDAHVAFVNALPVFIASDPEWAAKFTEAGVPIIGDDIKSQVGATITHRVLAKLFEDRGAELLRTYQLNSAANTPSITILAPPRPPSHQPPSPPPSRRRAREVHSSLTPHRDASPGVKRRSAASCASSSPGGPFAACSPPGSSRSPAMASSPPEAARTCSSTRRRSRARRRAPRLSR